MPVPRIGTQTLVCSHPGRSLGIETTGSQVPHPRLHPRHAASMPAVTGPEARRAANSSQGVVETPFSTALQFSTLERRFTCVRLADAQLTEASLPFPMMLTTPTLDRRSSEWFERLRLTDEDEGLALLLDAA